MAFSNALPTPTHGTRAQQLRQPAMSTRYAGLHRNQHDLDQGRQVGVVRRIPLVERGRPVVRSAILIFLAILAVTATPAHAQGTWLETRMIRTICNSQATPAADTGRLARRLNLTDPQKAALKDLAEASASADADAKKALCADKPDLSVTPGRLAFAQKMAETRLAGLKTVEPKLQAFYDSLDAKQKKAFDTGGRIGGIFDWWGRK
jgi:LTXXQ motif family protein